MAGRCARHPPNCDAAAHIGQNLVLWRAITIRTTSKMTSMVITPQLGPRQRVPNKSVAVVAMTAMNMAVATRRSVTPPRNHAKAHSVGNAKTWSKRPMWRNDFIRMPLHQPTRLMCPCLTANGQELPLVQPSSDPSSPSASRVTARRWWHLIVCARTSNRRFSESAASIAAS